MYNLFGQFHHSYIQGVVKKDIERERSEGEIEEKGDPSGVFLRQVFFYPPPCSFSLIHVIYLNKVTCSPKLLYWFYLVFNHIPF